MMIHYILLDDAFFARERGKQKSAQRRGLLTAVGSVARFLKRLTRSLNKTRF